MTTDCLIADLLPVIPLWARTVLFVGSAGDALAEAFRRTNPTARLLVPGAGQALEPASPLPPDAGDGIDCIVYRDVLETADAPWALLGRHAQALTRDGVMLLCLPNGEHWQAAERLLRGSAELDEAAPLPGGWFTADTVRRRLEEAGLSVCDVRQHGTDPAAAGAFVQAIAPGLRNLGIDPAAYAVRSAASHLIWRARKQARERMTVSASMLRPVGGVSDVRIVHPLRAIASDPSIRAEVRDHVDAGAPPDGGPRIFVLHRPALFGPEGHAVLRRIADAGYLIVAEFDDHPDHFPMMQVGGALGFRGAHAVQTSTVALAQVFLQYNPEVAVFPNALLELPEARNFAGPGHLTLFFGALNREGDWGPLMPALNRAAKLVGDRLRFQVVHDQGFFDALETPHKAFAPLCDYATYMDLLGRCEVSLMPLSDTVFNRCKSDLKFIEAGGCRAASLASAVVYGDSIEDGRTGLLFRDPAVFEQKLMLLLALPDLARRIGEAARAYVAAERMLAGQVAARIGWYRSLWERRGVLEAGRRGRLAVC